MNNDFNFLRHHVDSYACGEHDPDNSFLVEYDERAQFDAWRKSHLDAIPIGICSENVKKRSGHTFVAMVYEDEYGRFYTHIPESWTKLLED